MSQENVEIVRAAYAAWNAGDMDAFSAFYDPDVILRPPRMWPEPGPFVGREAVMRLFEQARDVWDADTLQPIGDFIDAADRVVVRYAWHGAGRGPESNMEMTNVVTVRRGKIFYQEIFQDHAEALEAAGLTQQAMPQDNVEIVRSLYADWERGDFGSADWADPEIEFVSVDGPTPGRWTGPAGMAEGWRDFLSAWEEFSIEPEEYLELDDERVLALVHVSGRGRTSGLDLGHMRGKGSAALFDFRAGRVTKLVFFWNRERAYADLDLAEQARGNIGSRRPH
jgi:ketosteroid isomerase-like protein